MVFLKEKFYRKPISLRDIAPAYHSLITFSGSDLGSEIYLKLARDYVKLGTPVNFYTVIESAKRKNETAIGYHLKSEPQDASNTYGIKINPEKTEIVTFSEWDRIIVLAED